MESSLSLSASYAAVGGSAAAAVAAGLRLATLAGMMAVEERKFETGLKTLLIVHLLEFNIMNLKIQRRPALGPAGTPLVYGRDKSS